MFLLNRSSACLLDFFFFFQAEDGIRDYKVTGVQTCALPIFSPSLSLITFQHSWRMVQLWKTQVLGPSDTRSEEHTSELQSPCNLVCRLLLEKKKTSERSPIVYAHETRLTRYPRCLPTYNESA